MIFCVWARACAHNFCAICKFAILCTPLKLRLNRFTAIAAAVAVIQSHSWSVLSLMTHDIHCSQYTKNINEQRHWRTLEWSICIESPKWPRIRARRIQMIACFVCFSLHSYVFDFIVNTRCANFFSPSSSILCIDIQKQRTIRHFRFVFCIKMSVNDFHKSHKVKTYLIIL